MSKQKQVATSAQLQTYELGKSSQLVVVPKWAKIDTQQFEELWGLGAQWPRQTIKMFGKVHNVPRLQGLYGCGWYSFSGLKVQAKPLKHPLLKLLLARATAELSDVAGEAVVCTQAVWQLLTFVVARVAGGAPIPFNGVFMNWYENGDEYISRHRDDEADLVQGATIVSLSFGETRTFRVRDTQGKRVLDISMDDGMLLAMRGYFLDEFYHVVPKSSKAKRRRINITLRRFNESALTRATS